MKKYQYIEKLNELYSDDADIYQSKLEFVGECIFNFTTDESDVSENFASLMLEVIRSILDRTTFKYQSQSEDHKMNYLLMVNMPFLADKLSWGTSIRGAWFDTGYSYDVFHGNIIVDDIELFMESIFDWLKV
jgi:hypothetical protein